MNKTGSITLLAYIIKRNQSSSLLCESTPRKDTSTKNNSPNIKLNEKLGSVSSVTTTPNLPSPCDKYNHVIELFYPTQRINKCNNDSNCFFAINGNPFQGQCIQRESIEEKFQDPFGIEKDEEIERDYIDLIEKKKSANESSEMKTGEDNTEVPNVETRTVYSEFIEDKTMDVKNIKDLFNSQLQQKAVNSIRDSETVVNDLAKALLIDVFLNPGNRGNLGNALQYLFTHETVLKPTRELVYWSVNSSDSQHQILNLSKSQVSYWLRDSSRTGGQVMSKALLVDLASWWILSPINRKECIVPLIDWCLKTENADAMANLIEISADAILKNQESTVGALSYFASLALNSQEIRGMAKGGIIEYLKSVSSDSKTDHEKQNDEGKIDKPKHS